MNTLFQPIIRFSIKFFAFYILLLLLFGQTQLKTKYADSFRSINQNIFGSFVGNGITEFLKDSTTDPLKDTKVVLKNEKQIEKIIQEAKTKGFTQVELNSHVSLLDTWIFGGLNMIFLLALIWASPLSWKQLAIATIVGLLAFEVFLFLKTFVFLIYQFNFYPDLEVVNIQGFGKSLINSTYYISQSTIFNLIISIFIWAVLCFDKKHWLLLTQFQLPENVKQN